eukprot:GHVN01069534.1.p3 GENE.GHVN01069534.1~~GHVN01069534.1.p3  ORF type:complete len:500 (+),score=168.29 GHVN01069534.1:2843-4342(+)
MLPSSNPPAAEAPQASLSDSSDETPSNVTHTTSAPPSSTTTSSSFPPGGLMGLDRDKLKEQVQMKLLRNAQQRQPIHPRPPPLPNSSHPPHPSQQLQQTQPSPTLDAQMPDFSTRNRFTDRGLPTASRPTALMNLSNAFNPHRQPATHNSENVNYPNITNPTATKLPSLGPTTVHEVDDDTQMAAVIHTDESDGAQNTQSLIHGETDGLKHDEVMVEDNSRRIITTVTSNNITQHDSECDVTGSPHSECEATGSPHSDASTEQAAQLSPDLTLTTAPTHSSLTSVPPVTSKSSCPQLGLFQNGPQTEPVKPNRSDVDRLAELCTWSAGDLMKLVMRLEASNASLQSLNEAHKDHLSSTRDQLEAEKEEYKSELNSLRRTVSTGRKDQLEKIVQLSQNKLQEQQKLVKEKDEEINRLREQLDQAKSQLTQLNQPHSAPSAAHADLSTSTSTPTTATKTASTGTGSGTGSEAHPYNTRRGGRPPGSAPKKSTSTKESDTQN